MAVTLWQSFYESPMAVILWPSFYESHPMAVVGIIHDPFTYGSHPIASHPL